MKELNQLSCLLNPKWMRFFVDIWYKNQPANQRKQTNVTPRH